MVLLKSHQDPNRQISLDQIWTTAVQPTASNDEPKTTPDSNTLTLPQHAIIEDLQILIDMYEEGLLTEEQFTTAKELRLRQ